MIDDFDVMIQSDEFATEYMEWSELLDKLNEEMYYRKEN